MCPPATEPDTLCGDLRPQHPKYRRGAGLAGCSWIPGLCSIPLTGWHDTWSRRAFGVSPPCQVQQRQSNAVALVTRWSPLSPVSLSGHPREEHSIPSSAMWCKDRLEAPPSSEEHLGCSFCSFLAGGEGEDGRGTRKPQLTWETPGIAYTTGLQGPADLTALP